MKSSLLPGCVAVCCALTAVIFPAAALAATVDVTSGTIEAMVGDISLSGDTVEVTDTKTITFPGSDSVAVSSHAFDLAASASYSFAQSGDVMTFAANVYGDADGKMNTWGYAEVNLSFATQQPAWLTLHVSAGPPSAAVFGNVDDIAFSNFIDDYMGPRQGNMPLDVQQLLLPGSHTLRLGATPQFSHLGEGVGSSSGSLNLQLQFVPLPAALWPGICLLSGLALHRLLRRRA